MASYAEVERVLAKINEIDESRMGAFRGRMAHFRRVGLSPASPGKGKRIDYALDDIAILAFAVELAQVGVDPISIKRLVDIWKKRILEKFREVGLYATIDIYAIFWPKFASEALDEDDAIEALGWFQVITNGGDSREFWSKLGRRAVLFNISQLKRDIDAAVASEVDARRPSAP